MFYNTENRHTPVYAADTHTGKSSSHNQGNFAEDREKASEAGRKGGHASHSGSASASAKNGEKHKAGNFADDHEKAAEAGRKGGHASHKS